VGGWGHKARMMKSWVRAERAKAHRPEGEPQKKEKGGKKEGMEDVQKGKVRTSMGGSSQRSMEKVSWTAWSPSGANVVSQEGGGSGDPGVGGRE